jgi:5-formyltetrahydrofolate cyclo-ligase
MTAQNLPHPVTPPAAAPFFIGADSAERADVMRWRKDARRNLIAERQALPQTARQIAVARIMDELAGECGQVIGLYWPFQGEPDLRPWAAQMRARGATFALPVVVNQGQPLEFREWSAETPLDRGVWDIPIPAHGSKVLTPDLMIVPVVGVDGRRFRLGYGGGYYDRTIAAMRAAGQRPWVIGVGFGFQSLPTIFPLDHDIAMDRVILA